MNRSLSFSANTYAASPGRLRRPLHAGIALAALEFAGL